MSWLSVPFENDKYYSFTKHMTPSSIETSDSSVPPSPENSTPHRHSLKITVATVTWNAGKLIERTIESVEAQTYAQVEHLIIDGNSRDNTLERVHHYQERNSRAAVRHEIVCISEPDHGIYDAMNKAIDMATGRYIIFLNAGDTFHSASTLAEIAQAATDAPTLPAVVYGNTNLVDGEGKFLRPRRLAPPPQLTWRSFKEGMLVCHQAFAARTDLARTHHYNLHYRLSADYDWCIRIMKAAETMRLPLVSTHTVIADYLNEGMTTRNHKTSLRERFHVMACHFGLFTALRQHAWFVVRSFTKK